MVCGVLSVISPKVTFGIHSPVSALVPSVFSMGVPSGVIMSFICLVVTVMYRQSQDGGFNFRSTSKSVQEFLHECLVVFLQQFFLKFSVEVSSGIPVQVIFESHAGFFLLDS